MCGVAMLGLRGVLSIDATQRGWLIPLGAILGSAPGLVEVRDKPPTAS